MIKCGSYYVRIHTECNTTLTDCPFDMSSESTDTYISLHDVDYDRTFALIAIPTYVLLNTSRPIDFKLKTLNFYSSYGFV